MVYTKSNLANIEASASSGTKASLSNKMQSIDSMKQLYEQSLAKFKEGSANSTMQEYVKQRGIDAERFGLCGSADGKMLLIPYQNKSNFYWIGRLLNPGEYKYYKPQGVKEPLFNETAFEWKSKDDCENRSYLIITEGQLDALSYMQLGFNATCFGTRKNEEVLNRLIDDGYKGEVIINFDNDEAGQELKAQIMQTLFDAGIFAYDASFNDEELGVHVKDANELLCTDAEKLREFASRTIERAEQEHEEVKAELESQSLKQLRIASPADAASSVYMLEDAEVPTPTGFANLDEILNGGLRVGVTEFMAGTSMGKTSFALQVADNIAMSGKAVLYVAIEQGAKELTSKSISRIMAQVNQANDGCVASWQLNDKHARERWSKKRNEIYLQACETYCNTIAKNLYFLDGVSLRVPGDNCEWLEPSVEEILQAVDKIKKVSGQTPIVFIDYLQLLAPADEHQTDKQAVDRNASRLRQASVILKTPFFVICSVNRSSYNGVLDLSSGKESGGIEYSADVTLALQPRKIADDVEGKGEQSAKREAKLKYKKTRDSYTRELEIMVLKQRAGRTPRDGIAINFCGETSKFYEPIEEKLNVI